MNKKVFYIICYCIAILLYMALFTSEIILKDKPDYGRNLIMIGLFISGTWGFIYLIRKK